MDGRGAIVLHGGSGNFYVFGTDQGNFGGYKTGDSISLSLLLLANWTVMVARNPAFRQKAPGIRGGVWGEAPRFFYFLYFFPVKITCFK